MSKIEWESVAYLAFDGERPVIITSANPKVLLGAFLDLVDDGDDSWIDEMQFSKDEVQEKVSELRWELHPVEEAKEIFCNWHKEPSSTIKPLPGQKEMFE